MKDTTEPFYKNGLKFTCKRCSRCCRHEPGYVFLSERDLQKLAAYLRISCQSVIDTYCAIVGINSIKRLSLKEKPNYDCIFWEEGHCTVYKARPLQCRNYPFWHQNLISRSIWDGIGKDCPGINNGKKHSYKEITRKLRKRKIEPFVNIS